MGYKCEACRQDLEPDDMVVVVRQQDVTNDSTGLPRSIDIGPSMYFHERDWHGGNFRVRHRVSARGKLATLTAAG